MEPDKLAYGYVIRPDGTILWDEDPNRHPGHKGMVLQDLMERGHTVTQHAEGHFQVHDFDPAKGLNSKPDEAEAGEKPLFGG